VFLQPARGCFFQHQQAAAYVLIRLAACCVDGCQHNTVLSKSTLSLLLCFSCRHVRPTGLLQRRAIRAGDCDGHLRLCGPLGCCRVWAHRWCGVPTVVTCAGEPVLLRV
jgi:hypothetical protein